MREIKLPFYARLPLTLLALVLIFIILKEASGIFIPLTFALLIAILLFPLNRFFENRCRFSRLLASLLSVVLFIVAAGSFIYLFAIQVIGFSSDIPLIRKRFSEMFSSLQHWLSYRLHITTHEQADYMSKAGSTLVQSAASSISGLFVSVSGILLLIIFTLIFTFFILYHRRLLMRFVLHLFSPHNREKVNDVISHTKTMINAYVLGLVTEMLLLSVVTCITFALMGIQYAILLGLMASILNIIPYIGIYTCVVLTMLVTFANSGGGTALEAGAVLLIIHILDSNILFPRIVGGRVKMNPFITIVAVIVGEFLWGIPGMFLFIPVTGIIKLVCERVEGMEAWAILIGVDETPKRIRKQKP
jgi:AI-2 transport protein TqsA